MKKTYMVAIKRKIIIIPEVYAEVVAESEVEAIAMVKNDAASFLPDGAIKPFVAEAIYELQKNDQESISQLIFEGLGLASQYHHPSECKLCASVERDQIKLKKEGK